MITFSASVLLWTFGAVYGLLLLLAFAHIFHSLRPSPGSATAVMTTGIFIGGVITIGWVVSTLLVAIDWSGQVVLDLPTANFIPGL